MRIVLVRHSDAVSGGDGLDDAARYLSSEGSRTAQRVAQALAAQKLAPTAFVASPRVRAVQTAEIFAQELGFDGPIERMESLCYTVSAKVTAQELSAKAGFVFAFGHMPTLPEVAKLLCRGQSVSGFAPSQAVLIEDGRVVWSIEPSSLAITRR